MTQCPELHPQLRGGTRCRHQVEDHPVTDKGSLLHLTTMEKGREGGWAWVTPPKNLSDK